MAPLATRSMLVCALLIAGCTTRHKVGGAGLGMTILGLGLTYSEEERSEQEIGTKQKLGIGLLLTGLVTFFVAAALEESATKPPTKEIKISTTPAQPVEPSADTKNRQRREQAWTLTKQAQEAARENNCTKVTEISAQVGALDAGFYADVFMNDVAIQRCFVPAETPPPTPAPPLPAPTP